MFKGCSKIVYKNSILSPRVLQNRGFKTSQKIFFAEDSGCDTVERKGLILGVYTGDNGEPVFTKSASAYNSCSGGKLQELFKSLQKTLKVGKSFTFNNMDKEYYGISLVGLGHQNLCYNELECIDEGTEAVRRAAGMGIQSLRLHRCHRILVESFGHAEQAGEGSALALWRYQKLKSDKIQMPTLELYDSPDNEGFQKGLFKAECQNLARRLSDTPANLMTPLHFAQEVVNELCPCGIKVEVHDKDWIESKRMNAFLTVARGSCEPPIFLEISYCGGPNDAKPILFVGKGITFDSGGLCLKKGKFHQYRGDMGGAAVIVAAIKAAAGLSLPLNIVGCIPLCENMPSGMAMKPGDVVHGLNNKSISIEHCDKEGRLIMADALIYGTNNFKPKIVIDIATMTSGISKSIGSAACGVYTNCESLWSQIKKASVITGDRVWRFPLWRYYTKKVTNFRSHDINNMGEGGPTLSSLGAAFLHEYVKCFDWIHIDCKNAGMVMKNKLRSYLTEGRMTGCPTRTIIQLLKQLCNQKDAKAK